MSKFLSITNLLMFISQLDLKLTEKRIKKMNHLQRLGFLDLEQFVQVDLYSIY